MIPSEISFHFGEGAARRRVPLSLTPFTVKTTLYKRALRLQAIFQRLVRRIIEERCLLEDICEALSPTDDFVRRLYDIWCACPVGEVTLDVTRSDYMLHCVEGQGEARQLKQVELNTISVSFAHLSSLLSHQQPDERIVRHGADRRICDALICALNMHSPASVAIMVVAPGETNLQDQLGLVEMMAGRMLRMTWGEIRQRVRPGDGCDTDFANAPPVREGATPLGPARLFLDGGVTPIGLVYYRTGYDPRQYEGPEDWKVRWLLEASDATKVPDVGAHLAGLKRVQQALTVPGVLEHQLADDQEVIGELRASFMRIYSLDPSAPQAAEAMQLALAHPADWVIKPQREGGGHNIYGEDIVRFLQETPPSRLPSYILMERIRAPVQPALLCRGAGEGGARQQGNSPTECISELGIYGVQLRARGRTLINEAVGHLVRTKEATQNEGGVVTGYACLANLVVSEDH